MAEFITKIISVKKLSESNALLKLARPKGFDFKAGQYLMAHAGKQGRPFSISSPPSQKTLELLIRKHENGRVTPHLYSLKKGDKLKISGPFGTFNVRSGDKELVFVAAGTGISPFRGMIIDALEKNPNKKITLVFGFRNVFYFENIFKKLKNKYKNFKLHVCCSNMTEKWKGLRGRVTEHFDKIGKLSKDKGIYICGPNSMRTGTMKVLKGLGFDKRQIRTEKWG